MALLMFRTFGVIIVSFIVLIMYVLHRKKNGKFIKRKAVNEEEKIKYQKWEKIINVMAVVGLLILGIFITVPCCLDIPYLLSNNLVEVTGEVTQGAMSGENSNSERRIHNTFIVGNTIIDNLLPYKDKCEYTNKILITFSFSNCSLVRSMLFYFLDPCTLLLVF